jgi:hypothetical protein
MLVSCSDKEKLSKYQGDSAWLDYKKRVSERKRPAEKNMFSSYKSYLEMEESSASDNFYNMPAVKVDRVEGLNNFNIDDDLDDNITSNQKQSIDDTSDENRKNEQIVEQSFFMVDRDIEDKKDQESKGDQKTIKNNYQYREYEYFSAAGSICKKKRRLSQTEIIGKIICRYENGREMHFQDYTIY